MDKNLIKFCNEANVNWVQWHIIDAVTSFVLFTEYEKLITILSDPSINKLYNSVPKLILPGNVEKLAPHIQILFDNVFNNNNIKYSDKEKLLVLTSLLGQYEVTKQILIDIYMSKQRDQHKKPEYPNFDIHYENYSIHCDNVDELLRWMEQYLTDKKRIKEKSKYVLTVNDKKDELNISATKSDLDDIIPYIID